METFIEWIALTSVILHPILFIRYFKNAYRYYFFILALMDPINYFAAVIFKSNVLIFYLIVFECFAIFVLLPGVVKRNKFIAVSLVLVLFVVFFNQIKVIQSLILFICLLIAVYISVNLFIDKKQFNSLSVFLILICIYQWLDAFWLASYLIDPTYFSLYIIKNCTQIFLIVVLLVLKDQRILKEKA
jgi:hypothetical protein